jgi:hypothetical protein
MFLTSVVLSNGFGSRCQSNTDPGREKNHSYWGLAVPKPVKLQGLGLEAVRQLCQTLSGDKDAVILTSRNQDLGQQAVDELQKEGRITVASFLIPLLLWSTP